MLGTIGKVLTAISSRYGKVRTPTVFNLFVSLTGIFRLFINGQINYEFKIKILECGEFPPEWPRIAVPIFDTGTVFLLQLTASWVGSLYQAFHTFGPTYPY